MPIAAFAQRSFEAMACACEVQLFASDQADAEWAIDRAIAEVRRIEAKFSRYRDDSVTSAVNRSAGVSAIAVDEETAALLNFGATCYEQSIGRFDLTAGVLRRAWDFKRSRVPSAHELDGLRPLIGWRQIEWQTTFSGGLLRLPRPGMELDFGGIGKEYAVDRAVGVLQSAGIAHALVNLGGDLRVYGGKPSANGGSAPWRVGIQNPRAADALCWVEITEGALATSGDYERYFVHDGVRFCHLLDATTGRPVPRMGQSVSVQASLCLVAGAQATLAMLAGDQARANLEASGLAFVAVDHNGQLHNSVMASEL